MTSTPSARVPPPEPNEFAFAGLLADLRQRGFGIGLRQYQSVARLAERWQGVDRDAFRDAIAALLARNAEEVTQIRAAFDEWAEAPVAPPPAPPPPETKRVSRVRPWQIALVLFLVACGAAVGVKMRIDALRLEALRMDALRRAAAAASTPKMPKTPVAGPYAPTKPRPTLPPPPREPAHEVPWLAGSVAAALALLVLAARHAKTRRGAWLETHRRELLEQKPGPHHYEYNVRPFAPPVSRDDIDAVASIIGRAVEVDTRDGDTLDVGETLRLTLHEGLRPQLRYEPPPRNVPLIVLQDASWQMRPWQRKADFFLDGLARQGVLLERWVFDRSPLIVTRAGGGTPMPFETLTARHGEASLVILGTGQSIVAEELEAFARLLKKWAFRTWIHPIGNPAYWRREIDRLPVRVWPMTSAGLRGAAVEIARRYDADVTPESSARRGVTRADVERMRQLVALVPHPSLALAEELRSRFCPEVPEEVLLFLGAQGVFYGETIRFPREQLQQLLDETARDPVRARKVREYLLDVLRDSVPPTESVAHLRWQIDHAVHRLRLGDEALAKEARATLHQLAQGPLGDEVEAALANANAPEAADAARTARTLPRDVTGSRPPRFAWPRWKGAVAALAVVGALIAVAARWMPAGEGDPIPHRVGVYRLYEAGGGSYRMEALQNDVPMKAGLFRDGVFVRSVELPNLVVWPLADDGNAWFDVRAELPRRNLAASEFVWVPARALVEIAPQPDDLPPLSPPPQSSIVTLVYYSFGVSIDVTFDLVAADRRVSVASDRAVGIQPGTYRVFLGSIGSNAAARNTREDLGTITIMPGQSFRREFFFPKRVAVPPPETPSSGPVWPEDPIERRLIELLYEQFKVPAEKLTPEFNLRQLDSYLDSAEFWDAVDKEFNVKLADDDTGDYRTIEFLADGIRGLQAKAATSVEVVLSFRSQAGLLPPGTKYSLVGNSGTIEGAAGATVRVPPGEYRVTLVMNTVATVVDTIGVVAGKPFSREITLPAVSLPRGRTMRLLDPTGAGADEVWTNEGNGTWTVATPTLGRTESRRQVGRGVANGIRGMIVAGNDGTEYLIPDYATHALHRQPPGEWTTYRKIQ